MSASSTAKVSWREIVHFVHRGSVPTATQQQKKARNSVVYDSAATKRAQETWCGILAPYKPDKPASGPVWLEIKLVFAFPSSTPKKVIAQGERPKTTKPDRTNLLKIIEDAMTAMGYFLDDRQVFTGNVSKWEGSDPRIEVTVLEAEGVL